MTSKLSIQQVKVSELNPAPYNPRMWSDEAIKQLTDSINRFGVVDPIIVNSASGRKDVVIGGHFRLKVAKDLGYKEVPVVYLDIPDEAKEKELNLRLNRNTGDWDYELLAEFDQSLLENVGFSSSELDQIFDFETEDEQFDLQKELSKLGIKDVSVKKGDVYRLGDSRLMCGDSTIEADILKLTNGEQPRLCFTDPPYILDYLNGKQRHGDPTTGFGAKKNRRYLETDVLPDNFSELWMTNIAKIQHPDFSIIVYENWKNIPTIWSAMADHWKIKNMLVWHLPNRHQGFSAKYKFFSKHDIAVVGATGTVEYNHDDEVAPLQEEYETALFAITGKPNWEGYQRGKKNQPTDFIEYVASDEQHSGQGVVFGTKPIEILIPYIKMLTKRGDLIIEPFGGSGSTLIAATKMERRCLIMEKSPTYAEVIMARWEKLTGKKRVKL